METPSLLAIEDVHLAAPPELATVVAHFYTTIVGLRLLNQPSEMAALVLCGCSAIRPRLIVRLTSERPPNLRSQFAVRVSSLREIQERAVELGLEPWTTQNLSFFDRRLTIPDPAGNRVDLVAYHPL